MTRVPQEERTRAMRARLLEATVELLVEKGYAGTSTTLVSERAGVSRGAQLHHFPTKQDLVVAAVQHLTEVRGAELAAAARGLPAGARRTRAVLRMLGDHFTSPVFTAALELWVAARTDAALLAAVAPLEQRVGRETHRLTVELLGADESRPGVRELVQATLDLVRGLGLADTITDDRRRRTRILDQWANTLDAALEAPDERPAHGGLLGGLLDDLAAEGDQLEAALATVEWTAPTPAPELDGRHPGRAPAVDRRGRGARRPRPRGSGGQGRPGTPWCSRRSPTRPATSTRARTPLAALPREEVLARWAAAGPTCATALRGAARGPEDAVVRPADVGGRRWPPRGSWRPGRTRSTSTTPPARAPSRPTGSGTSPTSASAPATSPTPCTARSRRPRTFRVELTAPSGETWVWGPEDAEQRVAGAAYDFCLLATQRVHRDDTDLVDGRRRRRALALDRPGLRRPARTGAGSPAT